MLTALGGELRRLFNTSGQDYKTLKMKDKLPKLTTDAALDLLSTRGNLVKRPFLLTSNGGVTGFKADEWKDLLELA